MQHALKSMLPFLAVSAALIITLLAPTSLLMMLDANSTLDPFAVAGIYMATIVVWPIVGVIIWQFLKNRMTLGCGWMAVMLAMFAGAGLGLFVGGTEYSVVLMLAAIIAVVVGMRSRPELFLSFRPIFWATAALDVGILCHTATQVNDPRAAIEKIKSAFAVDRVPVGMRDGQCTTESGFDYREACITTLEPGEFAQLSANIRLARIACRHKVHNPEYAMGLGEAFPIANCYRRIGKWWNSSNSSYQSFEISADASHRFVVMNYVAE